MYQKLINFYKPTAKIISIFLLGFSFGIFYNDFYNLSYLDQTQAQNQEFKAHVCFSPEGNCVRVICEQIDKASDEILIQAYSFTSTQIAEALIRAKKRGVSIKLIVDKASIRARSNVMNLLARSEVEISIDNVSGLSHNKVMIFDSKFVITGSYNFTNAANNKNAENLLLIESIQFAEKYKKNWYYRKKKSLDIYKP